MEKQETLNNVVVYGQRKRHPNNTVAHYTIASPLATSTNELNEVANELAEPKQTSDATRLGKSIRCKHKHLSLTTHYT